MEKKLKRYLKLLILFFIQNCMLISEEIDFNTYEIQHGAFIYSFTSPENWEYNSKEEKDDGLYVILRPESYNSDSTFQLNFFPYSFENENSDFPIIYIFSKSKSKYSISKMNNLLNSFDFAYKDELIELREKPFDTDVIKNDKIIFKHYFGFNNIFYVTFAYLEEDDNFLTFALITRNKTEHKNCLNSYLSLIDSYKFLTNQAQEVNEDNHSFRQIDFDELDRKKNEDPESYYSELRSYEYLEVAYKNKSKKMLKNFFDAWVMDTKPETEEEINLKTDLEKEIYRIFKVFYNPKKLSKYSTPSWGHSEFQNDNDEIYSNAKYILMQNSIKVSLYDTTKVLPRNHHKFKVNKNDTTFWRDVSTLEILDFAPNILFENAKVIHCNSYFKEIINQFLGSDFTNSSIYELPLVKSETKRKLKFLENYVKIIQGHWGGYYHIESFPLVLNIRMNLNMNEAEVFFKNIYGWYCANLEKKDESWNIISSCLMFVE